MIPTTFQFAYTFVHDESFEVWFAILMLDHCLIDFCPHDLLCVSVSSNYMLQINCNGHDFVICCIIYIASNYCLIDDMLDMVKHVPIFFKSPLGYIRATKLVMLPTLSTNILKM